MKRVDKLQLAAGAQYGYHLLGLDLNEKNYGYEIKDSTKYHNIAGFGEAFYEVNDMVALGAGIRYDKHTKTDGVVSPKGAIVFTPAKDHAIKFIVQSSSNNADGLTYSSMPEKGKVGWTYEKAKQFGKDDAIYVYTDKITKKELNTSDTSLVEYTDDGDAKTVLGNIQAPAAADILPEKSFSLELATSHTFKSFNVAPSISFNKMSELHMWNGVLKQTFNAGEYKILAIELDMSKKWEKLNVGMNTSYSIPLDPDTSSSTFNRNNYKPVYDEATKSWITSPIQVDGKDKMFTSTSALIKDQISHNGKHFNSMHTATAKFFADWEPSEFVTIHNDMRLFFGLWGRKDLDKANEILGGQVYSNLDITDKVPMAKWNMAVHFHLPKSWDVSVLGYDILGYDNNEHAARWQQMAATSQDGYFTVDQRTFGLKLSKGF